jgi:hypothetical protein
MAATGDLFLIGRFLNISETALPNAVSEEKIFKNQQYLYRDNCILNRYLFKQELSFF